MKKALKNIAGNKNFLSLFGNTTFAVLGFLSIFVLARSYNKDVFGEWAMYITAVTFVEMIRIGLTRTALVRFLSGAQNKDEENEIIASGSLIEIAVSFVLCILVFAGYHLFYSAIAESGFRLFFKWYPLLALLIFPLNNSLSILQAGQKFGEIILMRLLSMGAFIIFILVNFFYLKWEIEYVVIAHISSNLLASLFAISKQWTGIFKLIHATKIRVIELLNFGKFSLGTLIGSNLLKSSDTFILGIMMTKADAAIYMIPLKLIEVLEIPLRSFLAVALPRMSKESRLGNNIEVKSIFYRYSGVLTLLFIPLLTGLFLFAPQLVAFLGGPEYADLDTPVNVFRIFLVYGLFLTIDRFTGVTLDCINKPRSNLIKVIYMASANIIGDILAILIFNSLEAVAIVTILNSLVGVTVGYYFLNKELSINFARIPKMGWQFIRNNEFKNMIKK